MENELLVYQAENGAIQLKADAGQDTLWATRKQIADMFDVDVSGVNRHLKNIYDSGELDRDATYAKFAQVQKEGGREVSRNTEHYNLDAIISVGYRVNSKTATKFRVWATQTLKQFITQGYAINEHLLSERKQLAESVINDIQALTLNNSQVQTGDVLELVSAFTDTWFALQSYDEGGLPEKGFTVRDLDIQADQLYQDVRTFKQELIGKGEATDLFAQEKKQGALEGILGNVMQSMFGQDAYGTIEEKAANLLYFIVKNHPFNDGNKRTAAFSFVWFLSKSGFNIQQIVTPRSLTTLTLLVAGSDPKDKDRLIGLILQLLK